MMRLSNILLIGAVASGAQGHADVLAGSSPDPVAELTAIYADICKWDDDQAIPTETLDYNEDGLDDYLLTYDVPCRGVASAFAGSAGMARQLWLGQTDGTWLRVMDVNSRALEITGDGADRRIVLQHQGSYCMTADAAPCFLTLELKDNQLVWAETQHPSMNARLAAQKKGTDQ